MLKEEKPFITDDISFSVSNADLSQDVNSISHASPKKNFASTVSQLYHNSKNHCEQLKTECFPIVL